MRQWSGVAALAITALHGYTVLWLLGDLHCVRHNPPALARDALRVSLGFRARIDIPLDCIERVTAHDSATPEAPDYLGACLMGPPNLLVEQRSPVTARLLFGRTRECARIGIAVADPARARDAILARLPERG